MAPHTQRSVGVRVDVSDDMRVFVLLGGSCKLSGQTFSLVCESCYTHLQRVCGGTVPHRFVLFNWRATRRCIHQHIWFLVGKGYQRAFNLSWRYLLAPPLVMDTWNRGVHKHFHPLFPTRNHPTTWTSGQSHVKQFSIHLCWLKHRSVCVWETEVKKKKKKEKVTTVTFSLASILLLPFPVFSTFECDTPERWPWFPKLAHAS